LFLSEQSILSVFTTAYLYKYIIIWSTKWSHHWIEHSCSSNNRVLCLQHQSHGFNSQTK